MLQLPATRCFRRRSLVQGAVFLALVMTVAPLGALRATPAGAAPASYSEAWVQALPDQNVEGYSGSIAQSSPTLARLPGGPAAVVGDIGGNLWAFNLRSGRLQPGWPAVTIPQLLPPVYGPVQSPISASRLPGQSYDTVFTGVGDAGYPLVPYAYEAFNADGSLRWAQTSADPEAPPDSLHGDEAGLTVAGGEVVGPSTGMTDYGLNAVDGAVNWSFLNYDSDFSTPAVGDLYGNGGQEIVDGADSTLNPIYPNLFAQGGRLRIMTTSGAQICQVEPQPDQTIDSSPAVGRIFHGTMGIVVGTGTYYAGAQDSDKLIAMNTNCTLRWVASLWGSTLGSPALANVEGRHKVSIVEATSTGGQTAGVVYVLNQSGGVEPNWPRSTTAPVFGMASPVTADLSGRGYQDVIVPTLNGADVFDGRSGRLVTVIGQGMALQSTPLVTKQGPGAVGITLAGYQATAQNCPGGAPSCAQGVVEHFVVRGHHVAVGPSNQSWPMFHHDPRLTGDLNA